MSIMTWTRSAKCKDCKFLADDKTYKRRHVCGNPESPHNTKPRTLKDRVCDFWKYIYE